MLPTSHLPSSHVPNLGPTSSFGMDLPYPLPMRLGIDLDGVVADFNSGWIRRYNRQYGAELPDDAVKAWDAIPSLTHFEDMGQFWKWAQDHDGHSLFRHLDTYPGAVEALWELTRRRHEVVITTTKPFWAIHDTFAWLAQHQIPTREVHIVEHKWKVPCDFYLDDGPRVIRALIRHRPEAHVCRYVRLWNEPVEGAIDVASFDEFIDEVARASRKT
ncbi:MAG: 5' nucleotidase, NT5C type [Acidimicrobiia bacterium]